ncbi:MAG: TetR/AcrR family transcriptional regulator [Sulfitobacter sp.]
MTALAKVTKMRADATRRSLRREETKLELAAYAVAAISELGYARTGLRDIAAISGRSVGALTYHFDDKNDLICFCVRNYKERFVSDIDQIIALDIPQDDKLAAILDGLAGTIEADAATHRLWYDIRSQALFEEAFQKVVSDIEASLIDMTGRIVDAVGMRPETTTAAYHILDGLFQRHLHLACRNTGWNPEDMVDEMSSGLAFLME